MKRFSFFLVLFLLSVATMGQDTLNRTGADGKKQGYWCKTDSAGKKIYEGQFRDGVPYGTFRYYYPSGKLKAVSVMSGNGKRSKTVTYFPNGKKMAEGLYVNEQKDSLWHFYSEYDGPLISDEFYVMGRKEGVAKNYYASDGMAELSTWKDGMRNGDWEQYYSDGKLKLKGNYRDGLRSGPVRTYFRSGQVMMEGQYIMGDPDSTWVYFDEKGDTTQIEQYKKGILLKTRILKEPE
jgi:antitoxin component YwqK of YwqJK toxin-antitoxin module